MAEYGFEMRKLLELKYTEGNKGEVFYSCFVLYTFFIWFIYFGVFGKPIFSFFVFIFTF